MPSASNKVEKSSSNDADVPIKQVLNLLEKKVRNLEKRKGKLDTYKDERKKGVVLNDDQKSAVAKYDEVLQMLEFAKEMQKTATQCHTDSLKVNKKMARREQLERQQHEIARIKEILLLQDLLNNMGSETVRNDFVTGENGAPVLTPEKLDTLDELYKLVSSSRDDIEDESISHDAQLSGASEHLVALMDGKNKEVLGTTYKELKELLMSIHNSKYFDKSSEEPVEEKEEEVPEAVPSSEENVTSNESEIITINNQAAAEQPVEPADISTQNQFQENQPQPKPQATDPKFNFLQDSQIDLESPHMDPAVVVAHPMAPPPTIGMPSSAAGYGQNSVERVFHAAGDMQSSQQPLCPAAESREDFNPTQPIPSQTFTNQSFNAGLPQPFNMQHLQNQSVIHQNQDNQNPPPPIPMPNQQQPKSQDQQPPTFASAAHIGFSNSDFDHSGADSSLGDNSDNQVSQNSDSNNSGFSQQNRSGYGGNRGNRPPRGSGNRGTGGGYRGRGGYQNGRGGGGYQGSNRSGDNYYQSNNYNNGQRENGNFRSNRGSGAPRGMRGNRGAGGSRGRGTYNRDQ